MTWEQARRGRVGRRQNLPWIEASALLLRSLSYLALGTTAQVTTEEEDDDGWWRMVKVGRRGRGAKSFALPLLISA